MKTVIEMAREAGFSPDDFDNQDCECEECNFLRPMLERFAALVREDMKREMVALCNNWDFNVQGLIRQIEELK